MMCCPLSSPDECYENYTEEVHVDGVSHECCECGGEIAAGEKLELSSGDLDGESYEHTTCMVCREIRDHFSCDGHFFGRLWDDLEMNFFPGMRMGGPCMAGLSPAAKSALVDACSDWINEGYEPRTVALPPWWRWWYGDSDPEEGAP